MRVIALLATLLIIAGPAPEDQPGRQIAPLQGEAAMVRKARPKARSVPDEDQAPLNYDAASGQLLFRAKVAGRDVWAVIDTGAEYSLLDVGLAREAGLNVHTSSDTLETPAGEKVQLSEVDNLTIMVPGQFIADYPAIPATDLAPISDALGRKVGYVLGQDWLRLFFLAVEPDKHLIEMGPSGRLLDEKDFRTFDLAQAVPPQIDVTIGGRPAKLTIDTGFNGAVGLTPAAWAKLVPADAKTGANLAAAVSGATQVQRTTILPQISIGNLSVTDVEVKEAGTFSTWGDGSLGLGYLSKFKFILDMGAGKLLLSPLVPAKAL